MFGLKLSFFKHAYAGYLSSITHVRALFVLHDRGILANLTSVADWQGCPSLRGPSGTLY